MKLKLLLIFIALNGAFATALAALASHSVNITNSDYLLSIFSKASSQHYVHLLALFLVTIAFMCRPNPGWLVSALLFAVGITLFCYPLYLFAFTGAKMRNILESTDITPEKLKEVFSQNRVVDTEVLQKVASTDILNQVGNLMREAGFNFDEGSSEGETETPEVTSPPKAEPTVEQEMTDELSEYIKNQVKQKFRDELRNIQPNKADQGTENTNENMVRSNHAFTVFKSRYATYGNTNMLYRIYEGLVSVKTAGWKGLAQKGFTGSDIMALSHFMDCERGLSPIPKKLYLAIAKVGGVEPFETPREYLNAVGKTAGINKISYDLAKRLVQKGNLYYYGTKQ